MNDLKVWLFGAFAAINVFITGYFGIFTPLLYLVICLMIMDLWTRCYAASRPGGENIKSRKVWEGVYKKLGMGRVIVVTLMMDFGLMQIADGLGINIATRVIFTALTLAWIFVREVISNLENLRDAGIDLPEFVIKALGAAKDKVDSAGDALVGGDEK